MASKLNSQHPSAPEAVLSLECPACRSAINVDTRALIDGAGIRCEHCGADAVLQREPLGHSGHVRWELIEAGDDDEP